MKLAVFGIIVALVIAYLADQWPTLRKRWRSDWDSFEQAEREKEV